VELMLMLMLMLMRSAPSRGMERSSSGREIAISTGLVNSPTRLAPAGLL
jgi:hypothetical protein